MADDDRTTLASRLLGQDENGYGELPMDVTCDRCGAQFTLWFNGGELDGHTCACGRTYVLSIEAIRYEILAAPDEEKQA